MRKDEKTNKTIFKKPTKLFQPNNEENLEIRKISKFADKMIK